MKEKLYTIPVNEAFGAECECPLCAMKKKLETDAVEYTMGPSYMEDDIREATSRMGFCEKHLNQLYQNQNRLGLALMLKSHMDKTILTVEKHSGAKVTASSLFRKKSEESPLVVFLDTVEKSCFVCDKINTTFQRYLATIFHLYHTDHDFREKFKASKGFCSEHFKMLYKEAPSNLKGDELSNFITELNALYLDNMKRVRDDLEWFINKFDYRYADEPWKNAKDALPRSMQKTNSIL